MTLALTTSPRVGMLLLLLDTWESPAEEDLTTSRGGEYLVEMGSEDFPASARREGDFKRGGRTTAGRSLGGDALFGDDRKTSLGSGFGLSFGGDGLPCSCGIDSLD